MEKQLCKIVQKELFRRRIRRKRKKVAYKCDLCKEQDEPACVKACPKNALKLFDVIEEKRIRNIRAVNNLNVIRRKEFYLCHIGLVNIDKDLCTGCQQCAKYVL